MKRVLLLFLALALLGFGISAGCGGFGDDTRQVTWAECSDGTVSAGYNCSGACPGSSVTRWINCEIPQALRKP